MTPAEWKKIEDIFQIAADLPPAEREAYLSTLQANEAPLRIEVEKLLSSLEDAAGFIESPVWTDSNFLNTAAKKELSTSLEQNGSGPDEMVGKTVGVYRLTKQIGRGGMGAVYLGKRADGEFRQIVAVKLIKRGMDTDFIVRRFRHERQILASFEHPYIARLLDGGTTQEGVPYFVMEYIEGETLFNYCDKEKLSLRDRLKLFQKICSALEYAHERKIIHRDIKPSNILISQGRDPKLLDFGIAKILDPNLIHESVNPTGSMLRMMTPDYASPEQVRGADVTPASDIYSTGVLLYELLTGCRPYDLGGRALHEVSRAVCEEMPEIPSSAIRSGRNLLGNYGGSISKAFDARNTDVDELTSALKAGLDNIIMKAMAKEPSSRYSSMKAFSEDISHFLRGERVSAPKFTALAVTAQDEVQGRRTERTRALAILPFKYLNLGPPNDDTDDKYLGIGLADALITRLSKLRRLLVRPTSAILPFGESITDPISAGRHLAVDYVIDGSIKRANDRLRVTIQLLDVSQNAAVWATSIDESLADVLSLEDSLSGKLIEALLPQLTGSELAEFAKRGTDIPEAFEQYLRGRYYFNTFTEEGFAKAFVCFHSAISADQNYALAYCGIADYYNWLGITGVLPPQECFLPAIDAASKAIELDPDLSEAHATLGFSLHAGRYDWPGAERHLLKAIELNPGNAVAFVWYSIVLCTEARFDESVNCARRGAELDPLTPFNQHNLGWLMYFAERYDEAEQQYRKLIEDFPEYGFGYYGLSKIERKVGKTKDALLHSQRAMELMSESLFSRLSEAECFAADGDFEAARSKMAELEALADTRYVSPYQKALVYRYLGDDEKAICALQYAHETREAWLNWLGVDPVFQQLRSDSRVAHILEEIGYRPFVSTYASSSRMGSDTDPDSRIDDGERTIQDRTTLVIDDRHETNDGLPISKGSKWPVRAFSLGLLAILILAGGYFLGTRYLSPSDAAITPGFQNPAIIVLPFRNIDSSEDTVGTGLADALSHRLGYIKEIRVISANTGRSVAMLEPAQIGREVGASYVLRGTIDTSSSEGQVRAQFIDAATGEIRWEESFTAPDGGYYDIQSKITERIWNSLRIVPLPLEIKQVNQGYTKSPSAYEKYLIGRTQMTSRSPESLRRAIASFSASVAEDGQFAPAYVGLADAYALLNLYDVTPPVDAYQKAREFALRAISINDDLADAHATLAYVHFYYDRDRTASELEFRRAIQMNPSYAPAHHWFALVLAAMNKPIDAKTEIEIAERLDPKSLAIKSAAGIVDFFAGDYQKALADCDRALTLDPSFVPAHKVKRWVYSAMGDLRSARETLERERLNSGGGADYPGWQIIEAQTAGPDRRDEALAMLEKAIKAEEVRTNDFTYAFEIALAFDHLMRSEKALNWLERAEASGSHSFNMLEVEPRLKDLRNEPRFRILLTKLKNEAKTPRTIE